MSYRETSVTLTDSELIALDGRCCDEVQQKVDSAKRREQAVATYTNLAEDEAAFVADVVDEAGRNGKLVCYRVDLRFCKVCQRSQGYAKFRSGPRKGRPDTKRPIPLRGVEVADRFVRITGHVSLGCCFDCFERLHEHLKDALAGVRAEIPAELMGHAPRFKWHQNMHCTECGWRGHEGEMGRLPAIMRGTYPGKCPNCGTENNPLGKSRITHEGGHTVVEVQE